MNTGCELIGPISLNLSQEQSYSYTKAFCKSVSFTANMPFYLPVFWNESAQWRVKILTGSYLNISPPMVIQAHTTQEGVGVGKKTALTGCDLTSYYLSRKATDKATWKATTADVAINELARTAGGYFPTINVGGVYQQGTYVNGPGVTIKGFPVPWYILDEYDAHEGKAIDHVTLLLLKGGYGWYINDLGEMICVRLDTYVQSGLGINWVKTVSTTTNFTLQKTSKKFIKGSKVQTRYEFPFDSTGFKTVSFQVPMASVTVYDESNVGYIDEVALFDKADVAQSKLVGYVHLHPEDHTGVNYGTPNSAGPILSASLQVMPPRNIAMASWPIDARVVFVGIPADQTPGVEITFQSEEKAPLLVYTYTTQAFTLTYTVMELVEEEETEVEHYLEYVRYTYREWTGSYYNGTFYDDIFKAVPLVYHSIESDVASGSIVTQTIDQVDNPADTQDYFDCSTMPNLAHCLAVKGPLMYNEVKGQLELGYKGDVSLPMLPLLELVSYPGKPDSIINEVTITPKDTTAKCYPKKWW